MPEFDDSAVSDASPVAVWKILYDPARFPEWWAGIATVALESDEIAAGSRYTYFPDGDPDFPVPQRLDAVERNRRVVISCLISNMRWDWTLEPVDDRATRIRVHVEIPDEEAQRLDDQRTAIRRSLERLARLAADD